MRYTDAQNGRQGTRKAGSAPLLIEVVMAITLDILVFQDIINNIPLATGGGVGFGVAGIQKISGL
jgi:hypothetical protein